MKVIEYVSPNNGCTGLIYGNNLSICDQEGNEIIHDVNTSINTYEKLVEEVEEYPKFRNRILTNFSRSEFARKADACMAESCYLDQGITQCF